MHQVTRLKSGLTVATSEMPHMLGVSVGLWIGVGSRCEPAHLNGTCHFIEHLLFKGTKNRSAKEISQAVEGLGGYLNAYTSEETTCFHARARSDHFDEVLDVLVDMLVNSTFDPLEIAKEREVIKEEIAMYSDEPQHHVQELLNTLLWPDQPLGRPITGTAQTLDKLDRQALLGYLRKNYLAGNSLVVATGKIRHRQVVRAVERYAPRFKSGRRPAFAAAGADQTAPRLRLLTKRTEQTQLALGIRTCSRHDPRRYPLRLLNVILGENMSSRLFQTIREDQGLAYSIYSTPSFFEDAGDLVIAAGLDAANLQKTLRLIMGELRRMTETPPPKAELRRACDYVFGQIDLGQESTDNQMNWIGEQWLAYGKVLTPQDVKRHLDQVTSSQIRAAARDFFRADRLNLALVSPLNGISYRIIRTL